MISQPAGNRSERVVESESGILPPSTSNGWLQSFSKYWSAWKNGMDLDVRSQN
jgi:hypothetical protein